MLPRLRAGRFRRVVSSPAQRCRKPATLIARALSIPLHLDGRLAELDFGTWEGQPWDGIDPDLLQAWAAAPFEFTPPGGEPIAALVARVRDAARELGSGADAVVLSHGGPLRILDRLLLGLPLDPDRLPPAPGEITMIHAG